MLWGGKEQSLSCQLLGKSEKTEKLIISLCKLMAYCLMNSTHSSAPHLNILQLGKMQKRAGTMLQSRHETTAWTDLFSKRTNRGYAEDPSNKWHSSSEKQNISFHFKVDTVWIKLSCQIPGLV